jgi:hypothetical protein
MPLVIGAAVVAGVAVVALLVVGISGTPKDDMVAVEDGSSPTPTTELSQGPDAQLVFVGEVLEQTIGIDEMEAITDLNEFAKLPFADRVAYAISGQDGLVAEPTNDFAYKAPEAIPGFYWQNIKGSAINNADQLAAAKLVSILKYYGTDLNTGEISDSYKQLADSVLQNSGAGVGLANNDVFVASGNWQQGTDREGNPIDFINITTYAASTSTGEREGVDVTTQVIRQQVKLLDGSIVVVYAQGYGIEGQQSPIEGGTY